MNPLEQSIRLAAKTNQDLYQYFAKAGTSDHPRGFVLTAYRNARMAMREALKQRNKIQATRDVMAELRLVTRSNLSNLLQQVQHDGVENAEKHIALYKNSVGRSVSMGLSDKRESALLAVIAKIDAQAAYIDAVLQAEQDENLILGDEDRIGALRPGDVLVASAFWIAALFWDSWSSQIAETRDAAQYEKVAVAALDNRTTDCCLRVHGQVQPFDKPFKLTGTPRFADELEWTPFHWYCRTSIALYLKQYDNGLVDRMKESAQTVLDERAQGIWKERHPTDAFIRC